MQPEFPGRPFVTCGLPELSNFAAGSLDPALSQTGPCVSPIINIMGNWSCYPYAEVWGLSFLCTPSTELERFISPLPSPMTLTTTGAEAVTSPSHFVITLQADPSFESKKAHQPDVIINVEGAPTITQSEPPVTTKVYSLNIRKLNIKFAVICLALFLQGWNTGVTGPLILAIQKNYDVGLELLTQRAFDD